MIGEPTATVEAALKDAVEAAVRYMAERGIEVAINQAISKQIHCLHERCVVIDIEDAHDLRDKYCV